MKFTLALTLGMLAAGTSKAMACAACFGKSDSPLAVAMNWGILALLVVIATVLGLIASFFVFIVRREAQARENAPDSNPPSSLQP
jgi:heme/copper-type cytochrome/quinol oxidase subunit 2